MPVVAAEWEEHVSPLVETAHSRAAAAYSRAATLAGPHAKRAQQGLATALHTLRAHVRQARTNGCLLLTEPRLLGRRRFDNFI